MNHILRTPHLGMNLNGDPFGRHHLQRTGPDPLFVSPSEPVQTLEDCDFAQDPLAVDLVAEPQAKAWWELKSIGVGNVNFGFIRSTLHIRGSPLSPL